MSAHDTLAAPVLDAGHGNCGNCGRPLLGPYCYACGQPVRGLVRHFSSVAGDFFDTVLNWDARLPRTLWPLLVRPGYLTREYFAGRRVRYVSPVRLFVTLAIVTFFVAQLMLSFGDEPITLGPGHDTFRKADTVAEVIAQRDAALKDVADARKGERGVPGLNVGLESAEAAIRKGADARIAELRRKAAAAADPAQAADAAGDTAAADVKAAGDAAQADTEATGDGPRSATKTSDDAARPAARSAGDRAKAGAKLGAAAKPDPPTAAASRTPTDDDAGADAAAPSDDDNLDAILQFPVGDKPWDAKTNPVTVSWLPAFANAGLNALLLRAKNNLVRWRASPDQFKDAVLSAVPSTLFVLLPVFALLLKLCYLFKRRLYMEHLIVALHSHAFLCLALLLLFGTMALRDTIVSGEGFWYGLLGCVEAALWIWMPLSLLLTQKRVYAQGWPMTLLKYAVLGGCYWFLLVFGAMFTVMFSVIWG